MILGLSGSRTAVRIVKGKHAISTDIGYKHAGNKAERASRLPLEWLIPEAMMPSTKEDVVQNFPHISGFFMERELTITEPSASDVVAKMSTREWTALEVAKATCNQTAVAQQLLNCTSILTNSKPIGPLHGLPISLKDQFNLEGVESTIGYVGWAGRKPEEESTLIKLLQKAGAVFYVKTNVPTTLMTCETVSNLFGRTVNPRNRKLTTEGSSGGEPALVTFRGSFVGIGNDVGGSIRHPASYTGLYALRPSHGRVSYQQVTTTFLGQEAVQSSAGPLCRSPEDIRLLTKSLAAQEAWECDPQVIPLPWRAEAEMLRKKLCFGFGMGDGYVTPSPPLRRAMTITKKKLLAAGHNVIDFVPYQTKEASGIIWKMWLADGAEEIRRDSALSGEPLPPNTRIKPLGVFEMWQNQHRRTILGRRFLERWQRTSEDTGTGTGRPIDGLIMPSTAMPAIRHDTRPPWNYSVLSPVLDLATGVFPVTKVDLEKDVIPDD
ncbi:amidase signature domain-containing protein [Hypoxylon sp. FL1150]|nr:amidase signature domain-containing protein [Hypoxylon sp. FL1150]